MTYNGLIPFLENKLTLIREKAEKAGGQIISTKIKPYDVKAPGTYPTISLKIQFPLWEDEIVK